MSVTPITNLIPLDDRLTTAGQPTAAQLADVAAAGFDVVVNLAMGEPTDDLPDEAAAVAAHGMAYHHIPVVWTAPQLDDFARFVACMDACAADRRFVHCALNYRVTTFTSLYAQLRWGWSLDRAEALATTFWTPNETWAAFIDTVRPRWGLARGSGPRPITDQ
ncbi:MAG: protein tyrosine phosphatase family protein [Ardenticatenales bacterium]|nr:protein tyrosine phosphatase family protein [Ardenticatenales bacterium]